MRSCEVALIGLNVLVYISIIFIYVRSINHPYLAISLCPFLGRLSDPFKGEVTSSDRGSKGHELNHLVHVIIINH